MELNFGIVEGLPDEEQRQLRELKYIYDYHRTTNRKKRRYYNGKITLQEVNLGIALPYGIRRLQIGCSWGAKTVDVLAARSMFDGFVTENGTIPASFIYTQNTGLKFYETESSDCGIQ